MSKNGSKSFTTRRIVLDAVLIALFFVLSSASIRIGNTFKITFDSLACILGAMLFGPIDAFLVGFLGEFLAQMLSYGFTATTMLWVLGPAVRGLLIGLGVLLFKNQMSLETIVSAKKPYVYAAVNIVASAVTSCLNTLALYVDSKMFGYYEYHMVYGVLFTRIITGIVSSLIMAIIVIPILVALKKTKLVNIR